MASFGVEKESISLDAGSLEELSAAEAKRLKRRNRRRKTLSPSKVTTFMDGVDLANSDPMNWPAIPHDDRVGRGTGERDETASQALSPRSGLPPHSKTLQKRGSSWAASSDIAALIADEHAPPGNNDQSQPEPRRSSKPLGVLNTFQNSVASPRESLGNGIQATEPQEVPDRRVATQIENVLPNMTANIFLNVGSSKPRSSDKVEGDSIPQNPNLPRAEQATESDDPAQSIFGRERRGSRTSRRRSIVMPSEAKPFMEAADLLDGGSARENQDRAPGDDGKNAAHTMASTGETGVGEHPFAASSASCLSRPVVTQRGWPKATGETTKALVRAYYAAPRESQRARRIAALLFCFTGYSLLPTTPDDARVLREAAGDSLDWGLEETDEPRLERKPLRRKTRDQKRELVLLIKPLFDLMEKAAKTERLAVETATGIVARKAVHDGYYYEDRKTGESVDPAVYKAKYAQHVRTVTAARRRQYNSSTSEERSPSEVGNRGLERPISTPPSRPGFDPSPSASDAASVEDTLRVGEHVVPKADQDTTLTSQESLYPRDQERVADQVATPASLAGADKAGGCPEGEDDDTINFAMEPIAAGAGLLGSRASFGTATPQGTNAGGSTPGSARDRACPTKVPNVHLHKVGRRDEGEAGSISAVVCLEGSSASESSSLKSPGVGLSREPVEHSGREDPPPHGEVKGVSLERGGSDTGADSLDINVDNCREETSRKRSSKGCNDGQPVLRSSSKGRERSPASLANRAVHRDGLRSSSGSPAVDPSGGGTSRLATTSRPLQAKVEEGILCPVVELAWEGTLPPSSAEAVAAPKAKPVEMTAGESPRRESIVDGVGVKRGVEDRRTPPGCLGEDAGSIACSLPVRRDQPGDLSEGATTDRRDHMAGVYPSLSPWNLPVRRVDSDVMNVSPPCGAGGDDARDGAAAVSTCASSTAPTSDSALEQEIAVLEARLFADMDTLLLRYHAEVARLISHHEKTKSRRETEMTRPLEGVVRVDDPAHDDMSTLTAAAAAAMQSARGEETSGRMTTHPDPVDPVDPAHGESGAKMNVCESRSPASSSSPGFKRENGMTSSPVNESPLLPPLDLRLTDDDGGSDDDDLFGASRGVQSLSTSGSRMLGATDSASRRALSTALVSQRSRLEEQQQQQQQRRLQQQSWQDRPEVVGKDPRRVRGEPSASASAPASAREYGIFARDELDESVGSGTFCQLCYMRKCDSVLRPCNHGICRVCADKLKDQAEQSGESFSCPWDRQILSDIDPRRGSSPG